MKLNEMPRMSSHQGQFTHSNDVSEGKNRINMQKKFPTHKNIKKKKNLENSTRNSGTQK